MLCTSVSKGRNSTCSQVVKDNSLYIWLPDDSLCCKCCTAEQGCRITEKDWMKDYEYVGRRSVSWDIFDVWTHYDLPVNTSYWVTIGDKPAPRRIDYGSWAIDYWGTFSDDVIDDKVFVLPTYCQKDCPKTSFCENFKSGKARYDGRGLLKSLEELVKRNIKS